MFHSPDVLEVVRVVSCMIVVVAIVVTAALVGLCMFCLFCNTGFIFVVTNTLAGTAGTDFTEVLFLRMFFLSYLHDLLQGVLHLVEMHATLFVVICNSLHTHLLDQPWFQKKQSNSLR